MRKYAADGRGPAGASLIEAEHQSHPGSITKNVFQRTLGRLADLAN